MPPPVCAKELQAPQAPQQPSVCRCAVYSCPHAPWGTLSDASVAAQQCFDRSRFAGRRRSAGSPAASATWRWLRPKQHLPRMMQFRPPVSRGAPRVLPGRVPAQRQCKKRPGQGAVNDEACCASAALRRDPVSAISAGFCTLNALLPSNHSQRPHDTPRHPTHMADPHPPSAPEGGHDSPAQHQVRPIEEVMPSPQLLAHYRRRIGGTAGFPRKLHHNQGAGAPLTGSL
jgi:hypothetical protein